MSLGPMARALLYLRVTSFVGLIRSRVLRLRQPKYLAGAVVGAAYIYFLFIRRNGSHGASDRMPGQMSADGLVLFAEIAPLVLLVVLLVNWLVPRKAALHFTQAEIAFLFPAPVNRRMLIHYRLLGAQLGIVFTALIFTVAFGRGQGIGGHQVFHAIGWWLVLATMNLHFMGTSFVYSKLLNRSITSVRRRIVTIGIGAAVVLALIWWIASVVRLPRQQDFESVSTVIAYATAQLHAGPLPWLLAIPKAMMGPYFASSVSGFLLALVAAIAVLVAHYFWVVHTEVSFEEASIARAEKQASQTRSAQPSDWREQSGAREAQKPPFNLRSTGRPEIAFLWKNLLSTSSVFRPRTALIAVAVVFFGSTWLVSQPDLVWARTFAAMAFAMLLGVAALFGPMVARQDLRSDLANADILKTYPMRGWQIVLGELLTPLVILSVLVWICVLAEYRLLFSDQLHWLAPSLHGVTAVGLAILAPPFLAIQLLVPNTAAVLFPAWVETTGSRAERGVEVMGQRIIFMAGSVLTTLLAMLPAVVVGSLVFGIALWAVSVPAAIVLGSVAGAGILSAEAWWVVRWLGTRFERFDISAELRP